MNLLMRRRLMMEVIMAMADDDKILHVTLEAELTFKEILESYPIPLKYQNEWLVVKFDSDVAASKGTQTVNWALFAVHGNQRCFMLRNYRNSINAPNEQPILNTLGSSNENYFAIANDAVTASSSTSTASAFASGTKVYITHIPFDWYELKTDKTLR